MTAQQQAAATLALMFRTLAVTTRGTASVGTKGARLSRFYTVLSAADPTS